MFGEFAQSVDGLRDAVGRFEASLQGFAANTRDFREFIPLGDIVTSDMKHHALRRLEQLAEAADRLEAASPDSAPETSGSGSAAVADGEDA